MTAVGCSKLLREVHHTLKHALLLLHVKLKLLSPQSYTSTGWKAGVCVACAVPRCGSCRLLRTDVIRVPSMSQGSEVHHT
mgnify:CR=1 FL=1